MYLAQASKGALDLGLRGLESEDARATVVIGDQILEIPARAEILGLPPGPARLFVTAPGRRTAIVDTTIPATGKKTLDVELERL